MVDDTLPNTGYNAHFQLRIVQNEFCAVRQKDRRLSGGRRGISIQHIAKGVSFKSDGSMDAGIPRGYEISLPEHSGQLQISLP